MDRPEKRLEKQRSVRRCYSSCFGEEEEEGGRSWLHRESSNDGEYSSWWQKGRNIMEEAVAGTRTAPKWRLFIRRLKNEGRSMYPPRRQITCQYDAFSYAQNFDEGTAQESDYPYRCFSARFAAPLPKQRIMDRS